ALVRSVSVSADGEIFSTRKMFIFSSIFGDDNRRPDDPFHNSNEGFVRNGLDSLFQQMDAELKNQIEDMTRGFDSIQYTQIPSLGSEDPNPGRSLRDSMLKDPSLPVVSPPDFSRRSLPQIEPPTRPPIVTPEHSRKIDTDIDDKSVVRSLDSSERSPSGGHFFSHSKKVTVRTVQSPHGNFEHWRTQEDSSGRKEEVYTKIVDGQKHTTTRKIDSAGNCEESTEVQNLGSPYDDHYETEPNSPLSDNNNYNMSTPQPSIMSSILKMIGLGD
ncbi:uncharacterized protein LOC115216644, partial [Argonauta hians]